MKRVFVRTLSILLAVLVFVGSVDISALRHLSTVESESTANVQDTLSDKIQLWYMGVLAGGQQGVCTGYKIWYPELGSAKTEEVKADYKVLSKGTPLLKLYPFSEWMTEYKATTWRLV